jgi:hypothetical protein
MDFSPRRGIFAAYFFPTKYPQRCAGMMTEARNIGVIGTSARIAIGAGLLFFAFQGEGVQWHEALIGFALFPALLMLFHWARLSRTKESLNANGPMGFLLNNGIVILFVLIPYTRDPAFLFYGASMILAAIRGEGGCEIMSLSNWLLRRNDEVG